MDGSAPPSLFAPCGGRCRTSFRSSEPFAPACFHRDCLIVASPHIGFPPLPMGEGRGEGKMRSVRAKQNLFITNCLYGSVGLVLICVIGFVCWALVFAKIGNPPEPPTPPIVDISIIIAQTSNAAIAQTQLASSPTANVTSTNLPTLTQPVIPTPITISTSADGPVATNTFIFIMPTQPASSGAVCSCSGNTLNCGDFGGDDSKAQACMDYCISIGAGDIHNLDGHPTNGLACDGTP